MSPELSVRDILMLFKTLCFRDETQQSKVKVRIKQYNLVIAPKIQRLKKSVMKLFIIPA